MAGDEALFAAIERNDLQEVRSLVERDASIAAARNAAGVSALMMATYRGRADIARVLRQGRTEIDAFEAAALGETGRLVELLAEQPTLLEAISPDGFPLLGLACFFGHPETAELLLSRGADPNAAAENPMRVRPLHAAAATRDPATAVALTKSLLARGAEPNARQQGGWTALHAAAANGNVELVSLLVAQGADPSLPTDDGRTPAVLARENGHAGVADLLR